MAYAEPTRVRLDAELKAALQGAAFANGCGLEAFVEKIIRGWAVQHGLIGQISDEAE